MFNFQVDIYSLGMILYVMLTLRNVPLKGVPNFGQLIAAGKRPKITSMVMRMTTMYISAWTQQGWRKMFGPVVELRA